MPPSTCLPGAAVLILSLLPAALGAQDTALDSARATFRAARAAFDERNRQGADRAAELFEDAAGRYQKLGRALDASNALAWACRTRYEAGPPARAVEPCRAALETTPPDSTADRARHHFRLGSIHRDLGAGDSAVSHFRTAAQLYRSVGNASLAGTSWNRVGTLQHAAGRPDSALAAFAKAGRFHRSAGDSAGEGTNLQWQGYVERGRDSFAAAVGHYRAALALYPSASADTVRRRLHRTLGELFERLEAHDSSVHHLTRSFGDPPIGTPAEELRAINRLGDVYRAARAWDSARAWYQAGLSRIAAGADSGRARFLLQGLGNAWYWLDQPDSALAAFRRAIPLHRAAHDSTLHSAASGTIGLLEDNRGNTAAAIAAYQEAVTVYPSYGSALPVGLMRGTLAGLRERQAREVAADPVRRDSAIAALRRSLRPGGAARAPLARGEALERLAMLHWAAGRRDSSMASNRLAVASYRAALSSLPADDATTQGADLHSRIGWVFERLGQLDSMTAHFRISMAAGGRSPADPELTLLQQGARQAGAAQPDSAIATFREAARRFEARGSQGLRNTALNRVATLYRDQGQLDSALAVSRRLAADWQRLGNPDEEAQIRMLVAGFHLQRGELDSARVHAGRALSLLPSGGDQRIRAGLHGTLGTAFSSSGRYDSALVHHRAAVRAWGAAGESHRGELARSQGHLGSVFRQLGQFDSALAYHRSARALVLEGTAGELRVLGDIAFDFEAAGLADSALAYQRLRFDAARWRRKNTTSDPTGDLRAEAEAAERIGLLLLERDEPDSAIAAFQAALDAFREGGTGGLDAAALNDLARLFDRTGQEDSALALHRRAYALAGSTGAGAEAALAAGAIGRLEARRGNATAGLAALRDALARERASGSLEVGAAVLGTIGYTLRRLPEPDLPGALAAFDTAAAWRARVRAGAGADENRLSITEQGTLPVGEWELAWLARASEIGEEPAALAALAATERGRAQALLDLMRGADQGVRPGADLVAEGRRLLAVAAGAGVLSYLVTDDTLLVWYAPPGGGRLGVSRVPVSADSLAELVSRWRAALGVDQADLGSRLAGEAGAALERTRSGAAGRAGPGGGQAALGAQLARLLLPESLREEGDGAPGEIIVVPHGALTVIPFGALPLDLSGTPLGLRHALRYAPSLGSLAAAGRSAAAGRGGVRGVPGALVVGDPRMPEVPAGGGEPLTLRPLPAALEEGVAVARRLGVRPLSGEAATETAIRRRLPRAPLVHLATHGYAYGDAGRARQSFVALAPDATGDGLLTVGEVLDDPALRLSADLVVLSACQTGLGNLRQAEGTVGLQRAFLARGARSLLVSLWSVSDEATAILMDRFYQHWLSDPDRPAKAEALRRAQADLRATEGYGEPRYWAPFQVVGGR